MTPVIGIDLGTTNTVVAVVREGRASALQDDSGETLIPSVVSFHPSGSILVGRAAKERRSVDTANTIYSVKRLLGRSWNSEDARRARARLPFSMREGAGQAPLVVARGESYTLSEISAFVLRKARQVAEKALGVGVERAVVTVPANFNDLQRAATKVAGRVAGLEVIRILNEPTAAALAYGFGKDVSERLAVYDLGGGTFDITLLDLSENVFEVLATAGNMFLGGDDIDLAIADRMASQFLVQHRHDLRENLPAFERLRAEAERIKHELSTRDQVELELEELAHGPGGKSCSFNFSMTRAELEQLIAPLIDRSFEVCRQALAIARADAQDFDRIVLVGGSTRVPLVRQRVQEFFGKPIKSDHSPDEVVALGAAIQGHALSGIQAQPALIPPAPVPARRAPTIAGPGPGIQPIPTRSNTIPGVPVPDAKPRVIAAAPRVPQEFAAAARPGANAPRIAAPPAAPDVQKAAGEHDSLEIALDGSDLDAEDEPTRNRAWDPPSAPPPSRPPSAWDLPRPSRPPSSREPASGRKAAAMPLLVDVTPLTLCVETVRGFCDPVIARNTAVPCEQTRTFVTAADGQTVIRVRVAQGESRHFEENTLLGEVELSGLPAAPRSGVQIAVTFGLDANGMLEVRARELPQGRQTAATLRLLGLPGAHEVEQMALSNATQHSLRSG